LLQEGIADETYESYSRNVERQLLGGYLRLHGVLPPWSGIWGSRVSAGYVPVPAARPRDTVQASARVCHLPTDRIGDMGTPLGIKMSCQLR
jgi:hypothetical protein